MQALRVDGDAQRARGRAHVPADAPCLQDHFPGQPVLPGSLALELAAQVAGPLAEERVSRAGAPRWAVLGMVRRAVFRRPIELPASLELSAEIVSIRGRAVRVSVEVQHERQRAVAAELVMMTLEAGAQHARAIEERNLRVARWKAAWA